MQNFHSTTSEQHENYMQWTHITFTQHV